MNAHRAYEKNPTILKKDCYRKIDCGEQVFQKTGKKYQSQASKTSYRFEPKGSRPGCGTNRQNSTQELDVPGRFIAQLAGRKTPSLKGFLLT
jgi:hypothetical protein